MLRRSGWEVGNIRRRVVLFFNGMGVGQRPQEGANERLPLHHLLQRGSCIPCTPQRREGQLERGGDRTEQNRTEQNRTEQNRTEQTRTEQNRTEQNRTEQNRTEQNRTEQNRTEQNRTGEGRAKLGGRGTVARKIYEPEGFVVGAMVV